MIRMLCSILILVSTTNGYASSTPLRIMCLGDSITHGVCCRNPDNEHVHAGYRPYLSSMLGQSNKNVKFVGSLKDGPDALLNRNHEGHNGWTSWMLRDNIDNWLALSKPDIILLVAGTNSLTGSDQITRAVDGMTALLDAIEAASPKTMTLVEPIPPAVGGGEESLRMTAEYNRQIRLLIQSRNENGHHIQWVPIEWNVKWIDDGIHPNETGYQVMAKAWHSAILTFLSAKR
jgi:lysophospholipase L1-like esterase